MDRVGCVVGTGWPALPRKRTMPGSPGRRRLDDRRVLCGILFVLHTGIQWEFLPQELGFGSGMTCWRRLEERNAAGVWRRLHQILLEELHGAGRLDLSRAGDRLLACAGRAARPKSGPSPVDRGRAGSKHHVLTDAGGVPLATSLTGGHRNDVTQLLPLVDAFPIVRGRRGRPRRRPNDLYADRGYDHDKYRKACGAGGSGPTSPAAVRLTDPGSASTAGSSSAPSPGTTA